MLSELIPICCPLLVALAAPPVAVPKTPSPPAAAVNVPPLYVVH